MMNIKKQKINENGIQLKHDVDFYQAIPHKQKIFLSTRTALKLILVFLSLLIILAIVSYWNGRTYSKELTHLKQKKQKITAQIKILKKKYPHLFNPIQAKKLSDSLAMQLKAKEKIIAVLKKQEQLSQQGFSPFLTQLAEKIEPGVWLTSFSIEKQDQFAQLKGHAFKTDNILNFVKKLNVAPIFKEQQFRLFKLEKKEDYQLDFELRTQEETSK